MPADLLQPSSLPPRPLAVNERETARLLNVSTKTLYNWRAAGRGPRFKRAGGRILYPFAELERWLSADERDAGGQGGGQ